MTLRILAGIVAIIIMASWFAWCDPFKKFWRAFLEGLMTLIGASAAIGLLAYAMGAFQ